VEKEALRDLGVSRVSVETTSVTLTGKTSKSGVGVINGEGANTQGLHRKIAVSLWGGGGGNAVANDYENLLNWARMGNRGAVGAVSKQVKLVSWMV